MHHGGWDYFKYRWDRMQSAEIGDNRRDISHLQAQVMGLEQMLVYLVGQLSLGQKVDLADPAVQEFLHVKGEEDPRRAVLHLVGNFRGKYEPKLITCPTCGAKVRDLPGVTDEVCSWCGEQLETES